jgi:hypothetical protein
VEAWRATAVMVSVRTEDWSRLAITGLCAGCGSSALGSSSDRSRDAPAIQGPSRLPYATVRSR